MRFSVNSSPTRTSLRLCIGKGMFRLSSKNIRSEPVSFNGCLCRSRTINTIWLCSLSRSGPSRFMITIWSSVPATVSRRGFVCLTGYATSPISIRQCDTSGTNSTPTFPMGERGGLHEQSWVCCADLFNGGMYRQMMECISLLRSLNMSHSAHGLTGGKKQPFCIHRWTGSCSRRPIKTRDFIC